MRVINKHSEIQIHLPEVQKIKITVKTAAIWWNWPAVIISCHFWSHFILFLTSIFFQQKFSTSLQLLPLLSAKSNFYYLYGKVQKLLCTRCK